VEGGRWCSRASRSDFAGSQIRLQEAVEQAGKYLAFPFAVDSSGRNGLRAEAGRTPYYQDQLKLSALVVTLPWRLGQWNSSAINPSI
jgi:hypothetical protein